jgi:hypothetical protein
MGLGAIQPLSASGLNFGKPPNSAATPCSELAFNPGEG